MGGMPGIPGPSADMRGGMGMVGMGMPPQNIPMGGMPMGGMPPNMQVILFFIFFYLNLN